MLIESELPKFLWPYAIMMAAHLRNRCFRQKSGQTPYFLMINQKPNFKDMCQFGSVCYVLQQKSDKLSPKSKMGVFIGYDRYSPAYFVYFPSERKIVKS